MSADQPAVLHLVDDDGDLEKSNKILEFLDKEVKKDSGKSLRDVGLRYRVVGVLGGQSGGKSTLLNHLFGTKFVTMDRKSGASQTTKGAFLQKSQKGENFFIVDFEGTDGMERGEEQSFERQLSLFALSVADTLIINMNAMEIGRFNAANLSLLRAVFEVNLQLFAHSRPKTDSEKDAEKPTLLFVVRDYFQDEESTKEAWFDSVRKSLQKVWEGVTKPPMFAESTLEDLFYLKYHAMPHYLHCKPQFMQEVEVLRDMFINPSSQEYLFKTEETFRGIPLEGVPQYLESCWKSIKTSRDLNIPSQREMLAVCRCAEVCDEIDEEFTKIVNDYKGKIKRNERIAKLSLTLSDKIEEMEQKFAEATRLYTGDVVSRERKKMMTALQEQANHLVKFQCCFIVNEEISKSENEIQAIVDRAMGSLMKPVPVSKIKRHVKENNKDRVLVFWAEIRDGVAAMIHDMEKKIGGKTDSRNAEFLHTDPESLDLAIQLLGDGIERKVQARIENMASDAPNAMQKIFEQCLNVDPETKLHRSYRTTKAFQKAFQPAFHSGMLLLASIFALRMEVPTEKDAEIFLDICGPDEDRKPIYPKDAAEEAIRQQQMVDAEDDSRAASFSGPPASQMKRAASMRAGDTPEAAEAEDLLARSSQRLSDRLSAENRGVTRVTTIVLMNAASVDRAYELYQQQAKFAFQLRIQQIESGQGNIPMWVWGALLLFGFNDVLWLLSNPILIVFIIVIVWFFFKQWVVRQWQLFEEVAPPGVLIAVNTAKATLAKYVPAGVLDAAKNATAAPPATNTTKTSGSAPPSGSATPRDATAPATRGARHFDPTAEEPRKPAAAKKED